MIAIVKIAGKQFKVSPEKKLFVPKLAEEEGSVVQFQNQDILLLENEGKVSLNNEGKTIKAEVLRHLKGDKVIAFKMKRRKGFRKKKGHRTHYTQILIKEIA